MPSPFPGMDPYLEDPHRWPGVHTNLIVAFQELLNRHLRPRYYADVEERVYVAPDDDPAEETFRKPDVQIEARNGRSAHPGAPAVGTVVIAKPLVFTTLRTESRRERRVEVRTAGTRKLVAVIKLLSPSNKVRGAAGRKSFLAKRREVTASKAHWVEIDLLRDGVASEYRARIGPHEYAAHASPARIRPKGRVWPIRLQGRLPTIGIPLRKPDPDAPLDLQNALDLVYDRGAYDLKLDYTRPPVPPLPPDLATWADDLLREKGLR